PVAETAQAGADLLLVINGSPYEQQKDDTRLDLVSRRASEAGCPLAYVNMVGGQDDLVFDGDSIVVDAEGRVLARAAQFEQELLVTDLDLVDRPVAGSDAPRTGTRTGTAPGRAGVVRVDLGLPPVPRYEPRPGRI